jgi:uncharacterized protein
MGEPRECSGVMDAGASARPRAAGARDGAEPGPYLPPAWLRNAHVQSVLGSSPLRQRRGARELDALGVRSWLHEVDGGGGVRLHGVHTVRPGVGARGLAVLLHGWEGSAESGYMRLTAAALLRAGFEVFRLNFRDHGDTHHLNEAIFHSCRIDEVVHAVGEVARTVARGPVHLAGYSLGGNFALRVALRAPRAGFEVAHVAAVCPVLDPARTMEAMERGLPLYLWYFERKWRRSLARKRALFPHAHGFDEDVLRQRMRALTAWMVERYTDFGTLERYFDGYCIARDRLAGLQAPASVLMAEDDPVIPVGDFRDLRLPAHARLDIARWGGHCAFLENARLDGYAEKWVTARLASA